MSKWASAAIAAVQVFVAVEATLCFTPHLKELVPTLDDPAAGLITAAVSSIVVQGFVTIFLVRPRLRVDWRSARDGSPISNLDLRLTAKRPASIEYEAKLVLDSINWLGVLILRLLTWAGASVEVKLPHAAFSMLINDPATDSQGRPLVETNDANGVTYLLAAPPSESTEWLWCRAIFQIGEARPASDWTAPVRYKIRPTRHKWLYPLFLIPSCSSDLKKILLRSA